MFGLRAGRSSIRSSVLAIAFVPSVALLLAGLVLAGYLVYQAAQARDFANKVHDAAEPGMQFFAAVREERRLTLQDLASRGGNRLELEPQRIKTDAAAERIGADLRAMVDDAPDNVRTNITEATAMLGRLPQFRDRVDSGAPSLQEAYDFYNRIIDQFAEGLNGVAQNAPDAETAYLRMTAMPLFTSADAMSRGDALAAAGVAGGGLSDAEFRTYVAQIGAYHSGLERAAPEMIPSVRAKYDALLASDAWRTVAAVENAFLRGNQDQLPVSPEQWRSAAREVGAALMGLYIEQSSNATEVALDEGEQTLVTSIIGGLVALLVAVGVFVVAWRLSNRLVRRLERLREETLDLADERLPELVGRVRSGERVDLDEEVSLLDHGDDEIGQVADAFNKAQQTAVAAAVEEARTREGTKNVFLNIAHRSQVIVHRQLQALDQAERKQEDPDQLDVLFQLDHLSTRARRNAENLIILGGGQPGRQWRNPVALAEVVRGATAETEDYKRVSVGKLPALAVAGPVVGDLVHLLAELIDNAASFSPPQSRVEIRGDVVGRGVVIEVEDQGLGIEPEQADRLNALLQDPPDFSLMALSEEPRLGLFVVARLAAKHGVTVTLRESAYGGVRAIVLVRSDLLSPLPGPEDEPAEDAVPAQQGPGGRHRPPEPGAGPAETEPANGVPVGGGLPPRRRVDMFHPPQEVHQDAPTRQDLSRRGAHSAHSTHSTHSAHSLREAQPPRDGQPVPPVPPRDVPVREPAREPARESLPQRNAQPRELARDASAGQAPGAPPSRPPRGPRAHPDSRPTHERPPHEPGPGQDGRPPREPRPGEAGPAQAGGPMAPGRPPLPRRRRQQNLVPQLREDDPTAEQTDVPMSDSPEQARHRLAAFQRGTRQARESDPGHLDLPSGE
ncbi:Signal transduction histidine kinase [Amycolatopsis arida]|uniref:histidine kinase n=1 Tax=Amycolatopsis arida TaxID=587909 RepID=A0A1I5LVG3_9PSEU|nr:nitrate- and nitrite sensing domain-containing protein [Amycolatopsis arida]TDX93867.1 signal transduction histidine kinase [Amycolatopsis arida]SFP01339.1 Signal transduction histidine kinase [Amycolatopsis arida]